MDDFIEQDALANTPATQDPPPTPHTHEVSSFVATPRTEQDLLQKIRSWWRGDGDPDAPIVYKSANGRRYIFSITSNSYQDREKETITSAALKAYEESCFPGEGLYHNDNPYVWWHDDDVVMGDIVAVNYSEPFLVEMIEEIEGDPVSKVLFDFAEKNGHKAGASHKFGYLEEDRLPNGDYLRIFKQESTYLPDRSLAANSMTYAGVMKDMANQQSNEWLDKIFAEATDGAIPNVSTLLHDKSRDRAQKLAEIKGLMHKAAKIPPVEVDVSAATDEAIEETVEDEVKADMPMPVYMERVNQILALVMDLVDSQAGSLETQASFAKSLKALETVIEDRQTAEKAYTVSLEEQIKALETELRIVQKRLDLAPRRVAEQPPVDPAALAAAVDVAKEARTAEGLVEVPGWGQLKPPPNIGR